MRFGKFHIETIKTNILREKLEDRDESSKSARIDEWLESVGISAGLMLEPWNLESRKFQSFCYHVLLALHANLGGGILV